MTNESDDITVKQITALPSMKHGDIVNYNGNRYCITTIVQSFDHYTHIIMFSCVLEIVSDGNLN